MVRKIFMVTAVVLCLGIAAMGSAQTVPPTEKPVAPSAKPTDLTKALHKGGFRWTTEDGKFSLRLFSAAQFRYTFMSYDDDIQGNQEDYSNFYMRRARLWWDGHAYDPNFTYYFHVQLEPQGAVNLHDAWVQYKFSDLLNVGVGRNKIPYGLEFLNSGFGLHFVDRSVMYGETDVNSGGGSSKYPGSNAGFGLTNFNGKGFATGGLSLFRSQGISLSGLKENEGAGAFEYQVGVWNGRATRGNSNYADKMLYSARFGWHPMGYINWLQQGDVKATESYKLAVIGSLYTTSDAKNEFDESGYNLAVMNRYRGFSADFEYGTETFDYDAYAEDFDRVGWRADFGYFVVPSKVEVVARYAQIERLEDPTPQKVTDSGLGFVQVWNDDVDAYQAAMEGDISEITLGLNFYISQGHQHKLFFDVSQLTRSFEEYNGFTPEDQEDTRFRSMLQFKF